MNERVRTSVDEAVARVRDARRTLGLVRADRDALTASRFFGFYALLHRRVRKAAERPFDEAAFERLRSSWAVRTEASPLSTDPLVSIVIPAFNHCGLTIRCLQSIVDTWFDTLSVEIVLADDGSSDETSRLGEALPGLVVARNERNRGFVYTCNRGAAAARGRYLCFLNNDTVVRNAWLDELVATAESDGTIGVVGAKLIYPDGTLQEAGGIVYQDGSGANYGRGGNPDDSRFNYVRDVDYCSGAALLVRADLFRMLGGFDMRYAPAYYEDTDLCFGARAAGYRVVYQPRSEVVHYEGLTSGTSTDEGVKRHQKINQPKFLKRWQMVLNEHLPNETGRLPFAARRIRSGEVVLVVDSYVPLHDRESGSKRLFAILSILRVEGFHVIFLPDNYAPLQPYTRELEAMGIEVLYHIPGGRSKFEALDEVLPLLDTAWICRPELFHEYAPRIRRNDATRIVYDTIDLHFVRERRAEELLGTSPRGAWMKTRDRELAAAAEADAVVVVSEEERRTLEGLGVRNVRVVPNLHVPDNAAASAPFSEREGILFIGSYRHTPNIDAVKWLCADIMPLVRKQLPKVRVTLLGSDPPKDVTELASGEVDVPGYIADVAPYFQRHRVFVAPLRYGAGLKGKVGQSLAFGLPVVTTSIGAEGFGLVDGGDALIAESADAFADAIVRLYSERSLWERLAEAAPRAIEKFAPDAAAPAIRSLVGKQKNEEHIS